MKVELILNDDKELRLYIKELIQNEVINIAREQITNTVIGVLDKKLKGDFTYSTNIDKLLKEVLTKEIAIRLGNKWNSEDNDYLAYFIKQIIRKEIDTKLTQVTSTITANIINELKK